MVLPASIYISLVQGRQRKSRRVSFSAPAKKLAPSRAFLDVTSQLQSEKLVKAINMIESQ
jgi:D-alanyl-D-alanine carboxypeptidase